MTWTRRKLAVFGTGAFAMAVAVPLGAFAVARSGDSDGPSVRGTEAAAATAAALAATGGGHANSVERDTEDGATWEVEVTEHDGTTVDVRLDAGYRVVVIDSDREDARPTTG